MSRKLIVEIIGDSKSLERSFLRSGKAAQGFTAQITNTSRALRNTFAAAGLTVGVAAAVNEIRKAVSAASDLEEQVNKSNVVFGRSAVEIKAWSETTAAAFGLSQRAALEAAGGFGQILDTAGLTQQQAGRLSRELVELAADIASFNNIDPTEALDKLRSGLAGEAEPLRRIGVLLSETRVKQEAYASGIAASGAALTEGQKVQARYALILRDTATAQGDFVRTSDSLANQQRILAAQIENLRSKLGQALLPAVTGVVQGLNRWLASSENQQKVQDTLTRAMETTSRVAAAFRNVIQSIAPAVSGVVRVLGGLENTVKLLATAFVATKIARFSGLLDALGASAATSRGKVNALRTSLLKLGAIGVIAVGVEVILNRDKIQDSVNDFLRGDDPFGFRTALAGKKFELPADLKAADLQKFRDGIVKLGGVSGALIKELDKIIDRMRKIEDKAFESLRVPGEDNRPDLPTKEAGEAAVKSSKGFLELLAAINKVLAAAKSKIGLADELKRLETASDLASLAVDKVGLALERASATPTLTDDISALRDKGVALAAQEKIIRAQIALSKNDLSLQADLVSVQSQQIANENSLAAAVAQRAQNQKDAARQAIKDATELAAKQAAAARSAEQTRQFRALGLSAEGDKPIPTIDNLTKQLNQLDTKIAGGKNQRLLNAIRKVLTDPVRKATEESRTAIRDMFATIRGELDDGLEGPLTKGSSLNVSKVLAGLGLTPEVEAAVRARLSRFNTSGLGQIPVSPSMSTASAGVGGQPIVVHTTVELDGKQVGQSTKRFLQNDRRHNPPSRR